MSLFALTGSLQAASPATFALAFAAGVGTSLTPCVYPLIPVTVSILGSRSAPSKLRAFVLALSYIVGIASTYSILGIVAALTGSLFGSVASNPWVLLGVSTFMLALGLNLVDALPLRIPGIDPGAGPRARVGVVSNFFYGATFGLVASPCTAPPLAALLAFASSSGNAFVGGGLLFTFALGMGFFLLLLGTFASLLTLMPRSGNWMVHVKKGMGYLMIAMACYFYFSAGQQW